MIPDGLVFSGEKAEPDGNKKNPLKKGQKQPDHAEKNKKPPGNLFPCPFQHPILSPYTIPYVSMGIYASRGGGVKKIALSEARMKGNAPVVLSGQRTGTAYWMIFPMRAWL